jgi:hypothetical protein
MNVIASFLARFMWMPISTAPKNRKLIVSYRPYGRTIVTMATYYTPRQLAASENCDTDEDFAPENWYEEAYENDDLHCLTKDPTHWRYVPRALRRASAPINNNHEGSQS